jgi:opine dehydrogenase
MQQDMRENILVCSAGQGGHAIAAWCALRGNRVTLFTHTPAKAKVLRSQENRIRVTGTFTGTAQLAAVLDREQDLRQAVAENQRVIIVPVATAHRYYASMLAAELSEQDVLLPAAGVGGALEFLNIVRSTNPSTNITVSETDTLMYACVTPAIGHSHVNEEKRSILYTTLPRGRDIKPFINDLYPQFNRVDNPLMGLDDSPALHAVGMVKNAARILNAERFNFYIDGITPDVAEHMLAMDDERCAVARRIGLDPRTIPVWLHEAYGVPISDLPTMIQQTPPYQNTPDMPLRYPAPDSFFHRYLLEEIPLRVVPALSIGEQFGIDMPLHREIIAQASELTGIDFSRTGRSLEDMGLSPRDLQNWASNYGPAATGVTEATG